MKCPKCGKVLMKINNGNYICSPDCKYVFDTCKKMRNDIQKIVDEAKKEVMESPQKRKAFQS